MVPYCMAGSLITKAGTTTTGDDDDDIIIKGHEKRKWLRDLLLNEATQDVCGKYRGVLRRHRISK